MFASVKRILQTLGTILATLADRITSKWVVVIGHSMHPALADGQRVRVSRRAYRKRQPERWDIVFFEHPQQEGFWQVKRVVGLPGEEVRFEAGRLFLDEIHHDEPFVNNGSPPRIDQQWMLSHDEYVLLGDNRRWSTDSRSFGPVQRNRIAGLVVITPTANSKDE